MESRAASASISAQETVFGHSFSNADLISSITSNPLAEFLFGFDLFSLMMVPLLSSSTDASQPYIYILCIWVWVSRICLRVNIYNNSKGVRACNEKLKNLNKTVMEVKPEKRSSHSWFLGDSFGDDGVDDLRRFRAWMIVKLRVKIASGVHLAGVAESGENYCGQ